MRIYLIKCLNFSLYIPIYNYWHLLFLWWSISRYYPCADTDYRHSVFGFFRKYSAFFGNICLLSEIFVFFRNHSASFGNIRLLSETFVSPTSPSAWPAML